jgi:hypothetical protein
MAVQQACRHAGQRVEPVPGASHRVVDGQRLWHAARREAQREVGGAQDRRSRIQQLRGLDPAVAGVACLDGDGPGKR